MDYSKLPYYALFLFLSILSISLSMWGQYVTLPYKSLTMWEAYKMAIPFAWLSWIGTTFTVMIGHKYELVTPTQVMYFIILIQFLLVLIINQYYLKKNIYRSDIIAFFIILFGFFLSFFHLVSKALNIPIPKHIGYENPDEASSSIISMEYNLTTNSSEDIKN
jgi:hypothetical protein